MLVPISTPREHGTRLYIMLALFVLLDLSILVINFWITSQVEADARSINLAGRQRMLSQRITKSMLQYHYSPSSDSLSELSQANTQFNETLAAFRDGGEVTNSDGERIYIDAETDSQAQQVIAAATQLYAPLYQSIVKIVARGRDSDTAPVIEMLLKRNVEILGLMNRLTIRMEQQSRRYTSRLRLFQTVAFALAMLNLVGILLHFYHRFRESLVSYTNLRLILENIQSSMLIADQSGQVVMSNHAVEKMLGYNREKLQRTHVDKIFFTEEGATRCRNSQGELVEAEIISGRFELGNHEYTVYSINDISSFNAQKRELEQLALHDPLTNLPNRRYLVERIDQEIALANRTSREFALLYIDLDGFKVINDTQGHSAGDELLKQVTGRMRSQLRTSDTFCRLGGDEFIIVVNNLNDRAAVQRISEQMLSVIAEPFDIRNEVFRLSASIGISRYPQDGVTHEELLKHADEAMYSAKKSGKNCFVYYSQEMVS